MENDKNVKMENFSEKDEEKEIPSVDNDITEGVEGEEESVEETEDFSSWSKTEMLDKLKEILKHDDIEGNASVVTALKDLYRAQLREENEKKLEEYIAGGGQKEDFSGIRTEEDEQFEESVKKFFQRKKEIKLQKEKQQRTNLAVKRDIIDELRQLAKNTEDISQAFEKFHELQAKWRETGKVPVADAEDLWQTYRLYVDQFFDVVNLNKELRELDKVKNIELKTTLCEKAENLALETGINKVVQEIKNIQEQWKDVGFVPKEENDVLWERFKTAMNAVYDRQKEHGEVVKARLEENLKAKKMLCEEVEKLLERKATSHKEWQQESKKVEDLMTEWKKIGFVPKSDKGETWEKFKSLRKQFYNNRDIFYNEQKDKWVENLKKKTELCEKAEALKDSTDWEKTANELKRLQSEWKKIGPVSQKHSDKIWKRFRSACDVFFENKAKARGEQFVAQKENTERRREIIQKTNQFEPTENKEENVEALKNLQQEFENAGEISEKEQEELIRKFNFALDKALERIKEKTGEDAGDVNKMRYENLLKTEEGKNKIRRDRKAIEDKIKRIQSEITQTETNMGFFSKSKNAESMLADFQKKIDAGKEEIKKLKSELNRMPRV